MTGTTQPTKSPSDPFQLERFLLAQSRDYAAALSEVQMGHKESHWMWFVFPQLKGLGHSPTAQFYGIGSVEEARAYLQHEILGSRLHEISEAACLLEGVSATQVFGTPDDMKLRSSATLFAHISREGSVFHRLLDRYFSGRPDPLTLQLLADT